MRVGDTGFGQYAAIGLVLRWSGARSPMRQRSLTLPLGAQSARGQSRPDAQVRIGRLPQTCHLHSATIHISPLDSEHERATFPCTHEEIRDLPRLSVALDLFQRSQVQILPRLQRIAAAALLSVSPLSSLEDIRGPGRSDRVPVGSQEGARQKRFATVDRRGALGRRVLQSPAEP